MNHFLCFRCDRDFYYDIVPNHTFRNKYGKWEGIKCLFCQKGNAKLIGRECKVTTSSWELDQSLGPRIKHAPDMLQRFNKDNELSREFVETYPKQIEGMLKQGIITKEQVRKSKNVYKGMRGLDNLPHQGAASVLGKE